ncbi:MAG: AraC family transcriptional regulator, partial [Pseudomonadota bacterium]
MPDRIVLVVYDRFEILDMAGPASVFSAANRLSDEPLYDVRACSIGGGARMSLSGISVETSDLSAMVARASDTVLVTGARPADLEALAVDAALHAWLRGAAGAAKRYGSVCTGTIALAAAGLLVDADVTTHWDACDRLAALEPTCRIDRDTIYVAQDRLWTSAGVTTGIDMALAMVGADHGPGLAARVAQRLVM